MKGHKNKWLSVGLLLLGFSGISACDRKPHIREGICIRGMLETMSWKKCNEAGEQATKKGDYFLARKYFLDAVTRTEKLRLKEPRFMIALNGLGRVYMAQGDLYHAELIFNRVISESKGNPDDLPLASSLASLAKIYLSKDDLPNAEQYVKRALAIQTKKLGPSHSDVISTQSDLELIYLEQGRITESSQLLSLDRLTESAMKVADRKEYARAILYFTEAIKKAERVGPQDPHLIISLDSLAEIYKSQGKFDEAEPVLNRVEQVLNRIVDIHEKNNTPGNRDLIFRLNNWAEVYLKQGKLDKGGQILKRIVDIHEKNNTPGNRDLIFSLNNLAGVYLSQGDFVEAGEVLKRAIALEDNPESLEVSSSFNNLAGLYESQGKFGEAELFFKRALSIRTEKLGPSHSDVIVVQNNLASLYMAQKRFSEAEKILKDSIEAIKKNNGSVPLMIALLENYASLLQALKQHDEAEKIIRQFTRLKGGVPIHDMERRG